MNSHSTLELIVGVDFGFTCTGVAFCTSDMNLPAVVYKWPQREGEETSEHKVPTRVSYRAGREGFSWGFQCPLLGEVGHEMSVKEHFKLYLDPEYLERTFKDDPDLAPGTIKDVQNWFRDFFIELYRHIECHFRDLFPGEWEMGKVEYIFSVPTTWKKRPVIENFEEIVKKAGFGTRRNHSVTIGLSEAEAAAIYTAMYPSEHCVVNQPEVGMETNHRAAVDAPTTAYEKGDVLLVCDAGGGTTDVCVLEVKSTEGSPIELEQLSHVKGRPIGSVQIDDGFKSTTEQRLNSIKDRLHILESPVIPKQAARQLTQGPFQHFKINCGTPLVGPKMIQIRVPKLPPDFDSDQAGIKGGNLIFSKEDIEGMFEKQIEGIGKLIDKQITDLRRDCPSKRVSYIVLSGGLGSSVYVQKRIWSKYSNDGMKILVSEKPQLAVCKGLVVDRIHHLRNNSSALTIRRCRASYGILINEVKRNPIGRKLVDRIHWAVKKGEPIRKDDPISCEFSRIVDPENPQRTWEDKITISSQRKGQLPQRIREGDARVVDVLEFDLGSRDLRAGMPGVKEIKRWLGLRRTQLKIDYDIRVSIGPAGLEFGSWFGGEQIARKTVPVSWTFFPDEDEQDDDAAENKERPNGPLLRF